MLFLFSFTNPTCPIVANETSRDDDADDDDKMLCESHDIDIIIILC